MVGIVAGTVLVCAWIGWAIHVAGDKGGREAVGVLIAWPAIAAVVALLLVPFIWAFRAIRAGQGGGEPRRDADPESPDAEVP